MPTKVSIGSEFNEFPGRSFNELIDGHNQFIATLGRNNLPRPGGGPNICVKVKNESGGALLPGGVLVIDGPIINIADGGDSIPYQTPVVKGVLPDDPDHFGSFVVLLDSIADDGVGPAVLQGLCWVRVDVTDSAHVRASLKDGESGYLKSGDSGISLLYQELQDESGSEALGQQWALGMIGGGSGGGDGEVVRAIVHSTPIDAATDVDTPGETSDVIVKNGTPAFTTYQNYSSISIPVDSIIYAAPIDGNMHIINAFCPASS